MSRLPFYALAFAAAVSIATPAARADEISKAARMHRRLTGLNPSKATLDTMVTAIKTGKMVDAATAAIDDDNQSAFYNLFLPSFIGRDFDRDDNLLPLNDASALFVAMVRDDIDFREWLYGNITAVGDMAWDATIFDDPYKGRNNMPDPIKQPAVDSNRHYEMMQARKVDLKKHIKVVKQTDPIVDPQGRWAGNTDTVPAGVFTTRAFGSVYYNAGTNRSPIRFTLKNYLCDDIEAWHDTTVPDNEVRRDPSRSPGGEPAVFVNKCKGCHAGMDPMSRAFAYLDWDDAKRVGKFTKPTDATPFDKVQCAEGAEITLSDGATLDQKLQCAVVKKFLNNKETYPAGYPVVNDKWMNQWTGNNNARAGWPAAKGEKIFGTGPKALGRMFAQSRYFPRCMAKRALASVCFVTDFENQVVKDKWAKLTDDFVANGYKMKGLFAETATMCAGD